METKVFPDIETKVFPNMETIVYQNMKFKDFCTHSIQGLSKHGNWGGTFCLLSCCGNLSSTGLPKFPHIHSRSISFDTSPNIWRRKWVAEVGSFWISAFRFMIVWWKWIFCQTIHLQTSFRFVLCIVQDQRTNAEISLSTIIIILLIIFIISIILIIFTIIGI